STGTGQVLQYDTGTNGFSAHTLVAADIPVIPLSTGTSGNYVADTTCGNGIDCSASGHGATISFNTDSSEDQFVFDLGSTDLTCAGKTGAFGVGSAAPIRDIVEFCSVAALKHLFTADGAPGGQTAIGGTANSENLRLQSTTQPTRGSVIIPDNTRIGDTGTSSHALEVTTANIAASGGATATFDVSGTLTTNQDALIDLCPNDLNIGLGGGLSSMLNTDNCLINVS